MCVCVCVCVCVSQASPHKPVSVRCESFTAAGHVEGLQHNMCSAAALLAFQTVQVQPPENGQSGQSSQGDICVCQDESLIIVMHMQAGPSLVRLPFSFVRRCGIGRGRNFHALVVLAMPLMLKKSAISRLRLRF
jgi:hypothetical protein